MRFFPLAITALCLTAAAVAQNSTDWTYAGPNGPERWARLNPAYAACAKGKQQSPINIRGARLNKTLQRIEFHYRATSMDLENNGRTVLVKVKPGSYIVANGVRYELERFSFHHPGETQLNGTLAHMDVQLFHRSADGQQAILAVQLSEDLDYGNAVLAALWPSLPAKAGDKTTAAEMINPRGLIPAGKGYWTYMGSLSEPPCTEGVRWFVFEQDLNISREQFRAFSKLFPLNSRPVQETHGRKIEANE